MWATYTVTAQWFTTVVTEFEVDGSNVEEARAEAVQILGGPDYPPGGVVIAIRRGFGMRFWDRFLERQAARFKEQQGPPPAWWLPYFEEDETEEEETVPVLAN